MVLSATCRTRTLACCAKNPERCSLGDHSSTVRVLSGVLPSGQIHARMPDGRVPAARTLWGLRGVGSRLPKQSHSQQPRVYAIALQLGAPIDSPPPSTAQLPAFQSAACLERGNHHAIGGLSCVSCAGGRGQKPHTRECLCGGNARAAGRLGNLQEAVTPSSPSLSSGHTLSTP